MAAPSMRPHQGVRYAVERATAEGKTTVYRGFAHLPEQDIALEIRVEEGEGERASVTAKLDEIAGESRAELEKAAAALVKAAVRGAKDAGRALPRRIVRWRDA